MLAQSGAASSAQPHWRSAIPTREAARPRCLGAHRAPFPRARRAQARASSGAFFCAASGDPGDWNLSPEYFGTQGGGWGSGPGRTVFEAQSRCGNGAVRVTAHEASERAPNGEQQEWRVLRFGDHTRQSVALVTADAASPAGVAARADCLAFEYQKSLAAAALGLWRLANPSHGRGLAPGARVLCIGGGGGSLPLFLAATLPDSQIDVVEIDPDVVRAMPHCGFRPAPPRLRVHAADGAAFAAAAAERSERYDLAVIDAFDGDDAVPPALTQPAFLRSLAAALHPSRGAALMNVHGGMRPDAVASALAAAAAAARSAVGLRSGQPSARERGFDDATPQGAAAAAAASALGGGVGGAAFTLSVARQDNVLCCAARGVPSTAALPAALAAAAAQAGAEAGVPFDCGARAVRGLCPAAQPQAQRDWTGGGMSPA